MTARLYRLLSAAALAALLAACVRAQPFPSQSDEEAARDGIAPG